MAGQEDNITRNNEDTSGSDEDEDVRERRKQIVAQMTSARHNGPHTRPSLEPTGERRRQTENQKEERNKPQTTRKKRARDSNEDSTDTNEEGDDALAQSSESSQGEPRFPSHSSSRSLTESLIRDSNRALVGHHHHQHSNLPPMGIANPMLATLIEAQRQAALLSSSIPGLGSGRALNTSLLPQPSYLQSATSLQNYLSQVGHSAVANNTLNQILMGQHGGLGNIPNLFPPTVHGAASGSAFSLGTNPLQSLIPLMSQAQQQAIANAASAQPARPQKRQRADDDASLPRVLALPEDHDILSAHQIFLRYQIEAFTATRDDVSTHTRGRNKPVSLGQVGIRCRYCAHLPVGQRQKGSTYFPASLLGLYQAAQNMCSTHMQSGLCNQMPLEVRQQFVQLLSSKVSGSGAGRPYWARAAAKLGLVDTEDGIRLSQDLQTDGNNGSQAVLPSQTHDQKDF